MLKLIEKINNVLSVSSNLTNFCVNIRERGIFLDSKPIFENDKSNKGQLISNYLIIYNGGLKEVYNLTIKERIPLDKDEFLIKCPSQNDLCIAKGVIDQNVSKIVYQSLYQYSESKENIISFNNVEYIIDFIDSSILYRVPSSSIGMYSNEKKLWERDLDIVSENKSIPKYFGCIDNKLIFSDDKHTVFVLHKETGEIINTFSELPGINPKSQDKFKGRIMDSQNFVLDNESQLLLGAYGANYIEIDLKDNTCRFKLLSEIMEDHNILTFLAMRDNPFTNEHLFLTTINKGVGKQKDERFNSIVALNRKTLKIDWEHIFVEEGLGPNIPLICNDLLLQKTLENNLYIFQKDNSLAP